MKALNRKSLVVLVLSFIFALSMLAFAGTVKPVKAEGEPLITVTQADFQILDEASVRIGSSSTVKGSGIRFRAKVSDSLKTALETTDGAYMGFIITTKEWFKRYEGENYHEIGQYVEIEVAEDTFYSAEDGSWYVNGALNNIKEGNINREFTAVAYVYDGVKNHYSVLDDEFGRTYTQVIQKAFIDGYEPSLLKEAAWMADTEDPENPGYIQAMQTGKETVAIETSQDLYNLADSVANNKAFENAKFEITNDLVVDYDFAPIDSDLFAGEITTGNDKTITVYNNRGLTSILSNGTVTNLNYNRSKNLIDMTDKAGGLLTHSSGQVAANKTAFGEVDTVLNWYNFNNDSLKINVVDNEEYIYLQTNYTAEDLIDYRDHHYEVQEEGKELAVKFNYLAIGSAMNAATTGLMAQIGYPAGEKATSIPTNEWKAVVMSIENFASCMDGSKVYVMQTYNPFDLYIGGLEFVEWNFETDVVDGEYNYIPSSINFFKSISASTINEYRLVESNELSTDEFVNKIGFNGDAVKASHNGSGKQYYIDMPYSVDDYKKLALDVNKGFNTVKVTAMLEERVTAEGGNVSVANSSNSGQFLLQGNISFPNKTWVTTFIPIEDFFASFNNETRPNRLFLIQLYVSKAEYDFYFGGVEFVSTDVTLADHFQTSGYNFEVNDTNLAKFSAGAAYKSIVTAPKGLEVIENEVVYDVKYDNIAVDESVYCIQMKHNQNHHVTLGHTGNQYKVMADAGLFNAVRFSFLVDLYSADSIQTGHNNLGPFGLFSTALDVTTRTALREGQWVTTYLPMEEFLATFGTGTSSGITANMDSGKVYLIYSYHYGCSVYKNVYIRSLDFVTYDFENQAPDNGTLDFEVSAKNYFAISDSWSSSDPDKSIITKDNLPTEGITGTYDGDVFKVAYAHDLTISVGFNYTKAQFAKLYELGKFDAVRFTYLVETDGTFNIENNTATNIMGVAGYGEKAKQLVKNEWTTHTITAEQFLGAFSSDHTTYAALYRSFISVGAKDTFSFYFGEIELIKTATAE